MTPIMVVRLLLSFLTTCALSTAVIHKCKEKQDIAFVLDSSSSMIEQGLVMASSLALDVIDGFQIDEDETRIAFMTFGKESEVLFHFDTYYTKEEIFLAVTSHDGFNASASVHKAFKVTEVLFGPSFGSRPDVSRIMVFITNGMFKTTNKVSGLSQMLARIKEMKVKVLVAGVGIEVNRPRLEKMVEDKINDIVTAEEFNAPFLISRIHQVTAEFCDMRGKTRTNSTSAPLPTLAAP